MEGEGKGGRRNIVRKEGKEKTWCSGGKVGGGQFRKGVILRCCTLWRNRNGWICEHMLNAGKVSGIQPSSSIDFPPHTLQYLNGEESGKQEVDHDLTSELTESWRLEATPAVGKRNLSHLQQSGTAYIKLQVRPAGHAGYPEVAIESLVLLCPPAWSRWWKAAPTHSSKTSVKCKIWSVLFAKTAWI